MSIYIGRFPSFIVSAALLHHLRPERTMSTRQIENCNRVFHPVLQPNPHMEQALITQRLTFGQFPIDGIIVSPKRFCNSRLITCFRMIIRRLQQASIEPKNANIPTFQSWVVESDRLSNINDTPERTSQVNDPSNKRSKLDDPGFPDDIEAERTPFINPHDLDPKGGRVIEGQAENFIGRKTLAQFWDPNEADTAPRVDLNVLASSNPLFADYQYHNSNVLSIVDNFKYLDSTNNIQYLQKATCDYFVLGWHSESDHDPMTTSSSVKPQVHADRLDACQMELKESTAQSVKNWLTSSTPTRILCHASMYDVQYDSDHVPKRVPADVIGNNMMKNQSISVGVTPLDVRTGNRSRSLIYSPKSGSPCILPSPCLPGWA